MTPSTKGGKNSIGLSMKYFVLNPHKRSPYGIASRKALEAYADSIQHVNWELAKDLREWVKGIRLVISEKIDEKGVETRFEPDMPGRIASEERKIYQEPHIEKRYIED